MTSLASPSRRITATGLPSRRAIAVGAGLLAATCAFAQEPTMLSKPEVEAIAVNKKLAYLRDSDQKKVVYDLRDGGTAFYDVTTGTRNFALHGNYEITDDGSLCFKWQTDRYVNLPDACYRFRREGEKVVVVGPKNPRGRIGELVP